MLSGILQEKFADRSPPQSLWFGLGMSNLSEH